MTRPDHVTRPIMADRPDGASLDVHRPAGPGPYRAIMWLHGGALIGGRRTDLAASQLERYLAAGLAVVSVDYPLAPESSPDAILEGVAHAWAWLSGPDAAAMGIDTARLALVGHSAGGYLVLLCGPRLAPRPRAIVSFYGYGDVSGAWYTTPSPTYLREPLVTREAAIDALARTARDAPARESRMPFYLHCRQHGTWVQEVLRLEPTRDAAALDDWCPVRHVPADHPPVLLLHGDLDDDVPVEQSMAMAAALERAAIQHELIVLHSLGHGFDEDAGDPAVRRALDRVVSFLVDALN
jgi:acetyl esterase/lipase